MGEALSTGPGSGWSRREGRTPADGHTHSTGKDISNQTGTQTLQSQDATWDHFSAHQQGLMGSLGKGSFFRSLYGNFHGVGRGLYTTQGDASVTKLTLSPEGRKKPALRRFKNRQRGCDLSSRRKIDGKYFLKELFQKLYVTCE